ncbi:monooxygenase [Streptomonospora alba]|uniref:Monooxygenase n=2 Tax=Streptomonospora alba TaxID=183763 RepID=A0A0C2G3P6_9ACTN|nr:DUF4873 domain-containing protein [Streptomonospora alba]KIH97913.1 monooxygenase [Streptomonospora alba]
MSGMGDDEEEYHGPATLVAGGAEAEVEVHVSGHFDPLEGGYRWVGRVSADPVADAAYTSGDTAIVLRTPEGHEGRGKLAETNVWGGYRIVGSGTPPFAVPQVTPDED